MGQVAGGQLAAAVSNAGGLGLVGGGYGDPDWLHSRVGSGSGGHGPALGCWSDHLARHRRGGGAGPALLTPLPSSSPSAMSAPYAPAIKAAGCTLICQVQDVEAASRGCGRRGGLHRGPGQRGGRPWRGPRHPPPGPGGGRCGRARPGPGRRRHRRWAGVGGGADAGGTGGDDRAPASRRRANR